MALSELKVRNAKARDKAYKLADEKGMYLVVNTNGKKWWRVKYYFAGKEKSLSLGVYPETSLSSARVKRTELRQSVESNVDPSLQRRIRKLTQFENADNSFEVVAREWHSKYQS